MTDETTERPDAVASEAPAAEGSSAPRAPRSGGGDRGGDRGDRGGDRGDRGDRGGMGGDRGGPRRRFQRRKVCYFTLIKAQFVDYKDVDTLRRFVTDRGKILPRRVTGTSAKFQRLVTTAVKRARHLALLPYTAG